jgi:hypothetical protein
VTDRPEKIAIPNLAAMLAKPVQFLVLMTEATALRPQGLARYRLSKIPAQILKDLLIALLDFEQDRFRHPSVVLSRMHFARLQEDFPQIGYAFLREQHLFVGLKDRRSGSTIPRFSKLREV